MHFICLNNPPDGKYPGDRSVFWVRIRGRFKSQVLLALTYFSGFDRPKEVHNLRVSKKMVPKPTSTKQVITCDLKDLRSHLLNYIQESFGITNPELHLSKDPFIKRTPVPRVALISRNLELIRGRVSSTIPHLIVSIKSLIDKEVAYNFFKDNIPDIEVFERINWWPLNQVTEKLSERFGDYYILLIVEKEYGKIRVSLPGGKPEVGESFEEAALREFEEEVGFKKDESIVDRSREFESPIDEFGQKMVIWELV